MSFANVGIEVTASSTSGVITLPNEQTYYKSTDFDLKAIQYIFDILTYSDQITAGND